MLQPLAYRLRPRHIDEVIGQKHILTKGKLLYQMIHSGRLYSMILYGPPGTGKTSIGSAIANTLNLPFIKINAVTSGKSDVKAVVEKATIDDPHILFIDEIHRFNKLQQDYLLPFVEEGSIKLIGATTENPYHQVNPAIRSRCQIFELKPLQPEDIKEGILLALNDKERGLGNYNVKLEEDAFEHLARACGGDLRSALNALDLAVICTEPNEDNQIVIDLKTAEEYIQKKNFSYDKDGDIHYDLLSAFQKSIRGSDVNAAIHYLARLIESGDLESICRRMMVIVDEDIGLANTDLRPKILASVEIARQVGFPECRYTLATAVIELCLTPKSNSASIAIDTALNDIRSGKNIGEVPAHLRDAHYKGAAKLGRGIGYKYPHDYPYGWVAQQYMPDALKNTEYYVPKGNGEKEPRLAKFYHWINSQLSK